MLSAIRPVRWGLLAPTSRVARLAVVPALAASPTARVVAAASQSAAPSQLGWLGADRVHRGYQEVLDDPAVEVVYVPLPNSLHKEWSCRAAEAGKHVLCEKPLAPTQADALAMASAARGAGVVLMEAYMTPFHPRSAVVGDLVGSGRLGDLRFLRASFTGVLAAADDHRWRPEMGGGCLLDLGIYCLAPLLAAAGRLPRRVAAAARQAPTGVDASFSGWLDFGEGLVGSFECSFEAPERQQMELVGTEASLVAERAFTPGPADDRFTLVERDGRRQVIPTGGGDPYLGMIEHMGAVVRGDEQLRRPAEDSVELAGMVDQLRARASAGPAVVAARVGGRR